MSTAPRTDGALPLEDEVVDLFLHERGLDNLVTEYHPIQGSTAQQASILPVTTPDAIHLSVQGFRQASHYKFMWFDPNETPLIDYSACVICGHTMIPASTMTNQHGVQTLTLGLCLQCGFFQHSRRPPREWYADYYRKTWDPNQRGEDQWPTQVDLRTDPLQNVYGYVQPGQRVLEIGCGWGSAILPFRQLRCECFAVEATEHRSAFVRTRLEIPCLTGEAECIPLGTEFLQPGSFDLVFSTNVLEHVFNTREVLERAHVLLKPNGYAYIEIPNYYQENLLLNTHGVSHTCNFSHSNFLYLLQSIGFDLVRDHSDLGNLRMLVRKAPPLTEAQRESKLEWMSKVVPYRSLAHLLEKNGCSRVPPELPHDLLIDLQWYYWPKADSKEPFLQFQYYFLRQWTPVLNALRTAIRKRKPLEVVQHLLPIQYVYKSDAVPLWYY